MGIREIESAEIDRVDLTVSGDLSVIGWDKSTISYSTDNDSDSRDAFQPSSDRVLSLRADGDDRLHLPHRLGLHINVVHGDARIRGIEGGATIDEVNGDLRLEDLGGEIRINRCSGDVKTVR